MLFRIAICDDETTDLEEIYCLVKKYCEIRTESDLSVQKFRYASRLLDSIYSHGRYDIYILDIIMPNMNGIKLGAKIREKDNESKIILLTTSSDYGVDSYSISANDYILKPITEKALYSSLDKVIDMMAAESAKRYLMNVSGGVYAIPYGRLLYMEYYKHRLIAHMIDGETVESIVLRRSFTDMTAPLTEDGRFVQISSSYLVNMQYIRKVSARSVELADGKSLPLSRLYSGARDIYLDYVFEKEITH